MNALVEFITPSGETVALGHGALIGRLWSADLHLNDARISEAHAMVSLRGRDLRLLGLRGRFRVGERVLSEVVLTPGLRVTLAEGLVLEVRAVEVPEAVLAVEADGMPLQVLSGVTALFGGARPRVAAGWSPDATDHLWPTGASWMRAGPAGPVAVGPGDAWAVDGARFTAREVAVVGARPTQTDLVCATPVHITTRYDTVHLARPGEPVVVITGKLARVISELAAAGTAMSWEELARMCWPEADRDLLRHRWDVQLQRLRHKLRAHGLRADLIRADGSGLIELVLAPDDRLVDQS